MSERVDLQEFIGGFIVEAEELVASANTLLLEIELGINEGTTRPRAVRDLFRALHTIKGLAGMVGVEPIVEISHALETLVRAADCNGGRLRRGAVEVALQAVRAIGERVRAVAERRVPARAPESLLAALASTDAGSEAISTPPAVDAAWDARLSTGERAQLVDALRRGSSVWTLTFAPSEANAARGITIATVRASLAAMSDILKVAPRSLPDGGGIAFDFLVISDAAVGTLAAAAMITPEQVSQLVAPPDVLTPTTPEGDDGLLATEADHLDDHAAHFGRSVVRVDLNRLDELQEQLSLLIVSRFRLEREIAALVDRGIDVRRLREVAELQQRQLRDLRRAILRVRMVRVSEVLEPLALMVRSLTRPGVKEARLVIDARDAELDKAVADRLLPAIVHLVRNAIDHAIEPVEERLAGGKERAGVLRVTCAEIAGNQLELTIADDGRGIDRAKIARRAHRVVEDDETLLEVLTTPGFSTRDVATQTSGRGLGMDIVRRVAVTELGGDLGITTTVGLGTTFRMRVPLTIAIIEVFSFECSGRAFVVPVGSVEEIFELARDHDGLPGPVQAGPVSGTLLERRGRAMPVLALGPLLEVGGGEAARKAIVVKRNGEPVAFTVDRMLGRHEVVVRPVDDPLVRVLGVAGATDLGDGKPTLVLDLAEFGDVFAARERNV